MLPSLILFLLAALHATRGSWVLAIVLGAWAGTLAVAGGWERAGVVTEEDRLDWEEQRR